MFALFHVNLLTKTSIFREEHQFRHFLSRFLTIKLTILQNLLKMLKFQFRELV